VDSSARIIRFFEVFGWAYDVRWPSRSRIDSRRNSGDDVSRRRSESVETA
jgi:stearoyl-CoA desaturase (Delta-9 desaturase)